MADFDNGLPPVGTDPSEGEVLGFNYIDEDLIDSEGIKEGEIASFNFCDEDYDEEDIVEQEIFSFNFTTEDTEKINYMSMT